GARTPRAHRASGHGVGSCGYAGDSRRDSHSGRNCHRPAPPPKGPAMQPGPDMNALLEQAQQMQAQLAEAPKEIAATDVDRQAGRGLVTVTMRGTGEVTGVKVDTRAVEPDDVGTSHDLIVGAFGDAHTKVRELAGPRLGPLAQGGGLGDMMGGLGM